MHSFFDGHASQYCVRAFQSAAEFVTDRFRSLAPRSNRPDNPIRLLGMLNRKEWAFFFIGFLGWAWDAFDFFTVSVTLTELAKTFDKTNADISWGITLVLMMRTIGSVAFGIAADLYGRKWPYIINMACFVVFEMATGFCETYEQFLGVRALYGIAMGGLYGNVASTALLDCPEEARGLISGMFQQGYSVGYLLATVFARALVNTTPSGWRPLFWFGACPPVLLMIWRYKIGESEVQDSQKLPRKSTAQFIRDGRRAVRRYWKRLVYMVLLMTGMNSLAHGSQDLYPTMLTNQEVMDPNQVTIVQVIANFGAICGGVSVAYLSQSFGRRFAIISICIIGGALIYPYSFVGVNTGAVAFFEQFCVMGAWGVIPAHLMELSPRDFRTFVVGTTYQLGNLISSASSTIEAKLGERFPLEPLPDGTQRYEYGKVICIFTAAVYIWVIFFIFIGPEKFRRNFKIDDEDDHVIQRDIGSFDLEHKGQEKDTIVEVRPAHSSIDTRSQ